MTLKIDKNVRRKFVEENFDIRKLNKRLERSDPSVKKLWQAYQKKDSLRFQD